MATKVPLPEERGSIFIERKNAPAAAVEPDLPPEPEPPPEPSFQAPPEPAAVEAPAPDATVARPPAAVSQDSVVEPPPVPAPAVGEVIDLGGGAGSCALIRRVGRGGMAEVWLAHQVGALGFERDVAVKCIRPDHLTDDEEADMYRKMFLDEAHLAMSLTHPGIAHVYDLQPRPDGSYFLIMEYVAGVTLRELLNIAQRKGRVFSPALACYIIAQIADALHYAFNARVKGKPLHIVHRDVNPKNIMLGENGEVKLLDFGIAYSYLENRDRTRTGVLKGTYSYMSPEQAEGLNEPDTRSDLFALGIMLTELLTGRRPFDAGTTGARNDTLTIRRISEADPQDVESAVASLDPEMKALISRALEKDPENRYASGAEFASALRTYMAHAQLVCGPAEAVQELHELEDAPDVAPPPPQGPQSSPKRVKVFHPMSENGAKPAPAPAPVGAKPARAGPSDTRLRKRAATREKLHKPEDAKPRLVKPILVVAGVAIAAQLVLLVVIKMNHSDKTPASKIETVKTPAQLQAEKAAAERSQEPQQARPQLADIQNPSATLQATIAGASPAAPPPAPTASAAPPPPVAVAPAAQGAASAASPKRRRVAKAEPEPAVTAPQPPRHRSLDSSSAISFTDAPAVGASSAGGGGAAASPLLPRGTLVAATLLTPADATNPGPVAATVSKDVRGGNGIVIPRGSRLVCGVTGTASQSRVAVTCDSVTVGDRSIALQGVAMGADQLRGIPVGTIGGESAAEPARSGAINVAGGVLRGVISRATGGASEALSGAVGAGEEVTRRATNPSAVTLQPAPKGTHFFVFINSFGGGT